MQTILLTGATGFIGKNFIERVQKEKRYQILAFVDKNSINGGDFLKKHQIKSITIDDLELFHEKIDFCLHLASYGVSYGARNVDKMIDVNIKLSAKIAEFCSRNGCSLFINTGSCFEYGSKVNRRKINEKDLLCPEDIYAASKVAWEDFLKVYSDILNLKYITIRPFSIFGKYENPKRLVPLIFDSGINHVPLNLTGCEQIRDYMDVKDVTDAIYDLINQSGKIGNKEAINICSGIPTRLKDFILFIGKVCNFDLTLFHFGILPYRENESLYFCGENLRLTEIIGRKDYSVTEEKIYKCYKNHLENLKN